MTTTYDLDDRGFKHYPPIPSRYGGEVTVHESSLAEYPALWVNVESPVDLNEPTGPTQRSVALLTLDDAESLRDQLTHLLENHYQVRSA